MVWVALRMLPSCTVYSFQAVFRGPPAPQAHCAVLSKTGFFPAFFINLTSSDKSLCDQTFTKSSRCP